MKFFGLLSLLLTSVINLTTLINVNSYFQDYETAVWLSGAAYCDKENYFDMVLAGPATGFIVKNILYDKLYKIQKL